MTMGKMGVGYIICNGVFRGRSMHDIVPKVRRFVCRSIKPSRSLERGGKFGHGCVIGMSCGAGGRCGVRNGFFLICVIIRRYFIHQGKLP